MVAATGAAILIPVDATIESDYRKLREALEIAMATGNDADVRRLLAALPVDDYRDRIAEHVGRGEYEAAIGVIDRLGFVAEEKTRNTRQAALWFVLVGVPILAVSSYTLFRTLGFGGPTPARVAEPTPACRASLRGALEAIVRERGLGATVTDEAVDRLAAGNTAQLHAGFADMSYTFTFRTGVEDGVCQVVLYRRSRSEPGEYSVAPMDAQAPAPDCTCR